MEANDPSKIQHWHEEALARLRAGRSPSFVARLLVQHGVDAVLAAAIVEQARQALREEHQEAQGFLPYTEEVDVHGQTSHTNEEPHAQHNDSDASFVYALELARQGMSDTE